MSHLKKTMIFRKWFYRKHIESCSSNDSIIKSCSQILLNNYSTSSHIHNI